MSQQTPRTDAYRDSVSAMDVAIHPLREFQGALDFASTLELECARLAQEKAGLVKALQTIVDLDDGDTPDLWHFEKEFSEARDVLAALAKEAK